VSARRLTANAAAWALLEAARALGENAEAVAAGQVTQSRAAYHALSALDVAYNLPRRLHARAALLGLAAQWRTGFRPGWTYFAGKPVDAALVQRLVRGLT